LRAVAGSSYTASAASQAGPRSASRRTGEAIVNGVKKSRLAMVTLQPRAALSAGTAGHPIGG
jgi:hypothetical protein